MHAQTEGSTWRIGASAALGAALLGLGASWSYGLPVAVRPSPLLALALSGPRLLLAAAAGAAFGLSGALEVTPAQAPVRELRRFALSCGAAFGAGMVIAFGPVGLAHTPFGLVLGGALGAGLALALVAALTRPHRALVPLLGLLLPGLVAAAVIGAGAAKGELSALRAPLQWLLGDVSNATWLGGGCVFAATSVLLVLALQGVPSGAGAGAGATQRQAQLGLGALALAMGAVGPVAFVSLFAPKLARALAGRTSERAHLALCALAGATSLVLLDAVPRALIGGFAFPLNVQTGILAAGPVLWSYARGLRQDGAPPRSPRFAYVERATALLVALVLFAAALALTLLVRSLG